LVEKWSNSELFEENQWKIFKNQREFRDFEKILVEILTFRAIFSKSPS